MRYLSILTALIMTCAVLFVGCNSSTEEEEQPDSQTNIEQVTKESESNTQTNIEQVTRESESNNMFEFKTEELCCKKDELNIYGQIYIPQVEDNRKLPAVIIGHGFGGTYIKNFRFAETFAKNGIVAYVFDFCGGSTSSQSDGKTTEMSVLTEKADMLAAFEKISKLDYVDEDNIFLMGESQGGLVASLCAAELTDNIRGLALLYPAYNIPDMAKSTFENVSSLPDEYELWGMTIGKPYYIDSQTIDVYNEIGKYKGPVQIYHGTDDSIVPYSYSEKAVEVYANAQLIEEKGMNHGFDSDLEYSIAKDILKFINSNIA